MALEKKLGVDIVKEKLKNYCKSVAGRNLITETFFTDNVLEIGSKFSYVAKLMKFLQEEPPAFPELDDCLQPLSEIKIKGSVITLESLVIIKMWIETSCNWSDFLIAKSNHEQGFKDILNGAFNNRSLLLEIYKTVKEDGSIQEDASPILAKVFADIRRLYQKQNSLTTTIYKEAKRKGYVPEGGSVSIKNGRTVVPVIAKYKKYISGILQDESSTGKVLFIEPSESVSVSNSILEKENEKKREIHRILSQLSRRMHAEYASLVKMVSFIARLDTLLSRAIFAVENNYIIPKINSNSDSKIYGGFHLLLKWNNDDLGKGTEPIDIELSQDQRIVLISGPNAGGKSVAIKTFGLLQYLVQCAIPIPAEETSEFGVYSNFFAVIGDEQSIENDLSTYSSHLYNLKNITKNAEEKSLVLIDEFGSGTEPVMGGAIAEAVLNRLLKMEVRCLITTHYLNLKEFADREKGIINASMRFDMENLKPLYKIEIGKPGGSFAIEMMNKVGFPHQLIHNAKKIAGEEVINMEKMLAKVQRQKKRIDEREKNIRSLEKELFDKRQKLESLQNKLDKEKSEIIEGAKNEARDLLKSANREIEKTIRHIKESKAHKNETRKVRGKFDQFRKKVKKLENAEIEVEKKLIPEEGIVSIGDFALIEGQSVPGKVEDIKGKTAHLIVNGVSVKVSLKRLSKVSAGEARRQFRQPSYAIDTTGRKAAFNSRLDLRGKRGDESLAELDRFLDDALLLGEKHLTVIHGMGEGILKKLIREHLRNLNYIDRFSDGDPDHGGAGFTEITLK